MFCSECEQGALQYSLMLATKYSKLNARATRVFLYFTIL